MSKEYTGRFWHLAICIGRITGNFYDAARATASYRHDVIHMIHGGAPMRTTQNPKYGADDRPFEHLVQLSGLAVSPSVEDLSFLERKFEEAHWKLYTAGTYRETLAELS